MVFARQEVLLLTGLSSKQLSYLDKLGIISPEKIGSTKKPYCNYSLMQLIMLMAYSKLREDCSLQQLKDAFLDMQDVHPFHLFWDKRIVVTSDKVFWIESDEMVAVQKVFNQLLNNEKPLTILPFSFKVRDLIEEMRQRALDNGVNFFEERLEKAIEKSKAA